MADEETGEQTVEGRGARVLNTGIALLHEGEIVLPAAGSEAQAERVIDDMQAVIHYHFPVEIEVRAAPNLVDPDQIIEKTLLRLVQGLKGL